MKILFVYRHPGLGYSIGKVFRTIETEIKKYAEVDSLYMPVPSYSPASLLKNIKAAASHCKGKRYDIVHITGTEYYLIPFLRHQKVIATVHDFGHYLGLRNPRRLAYWIEHIAPLNNADAITCISAHTATEVEQAMGSAAKRKITVIPNAIDRTFTPCPKDFRTDCPTVMHIGARPHKNLTRAIEALKGIRCKLRIVEKASCSDIKMMEAYGTDYAALHDLTDKELLQEYENADIISFPSLHEGFGMPIIEGQSIGRIVITSDMEPMKSIAGNGAILCDPYDTESIRNAYLIAINDTSLRENTIRHGFENVKKYHPDIVAKQYLELYKSI